MVIKNICCIGAGYVGGPTMAVIAKNNPQINITIVDINADRIAAWNDSDESKLPIYEPGLADIVRETRYKNLFFSTNIDKVIDESEMIFISVNTPTKTYGRGKGMAADLKYIELCARNIAEVAKSDKIVVEKSTLPVRTAEAIKNILDNTGNNISFHILSNPEFLAEGTAVNDLLNPDRVIKTLYNTVSRKKIGMLGWAFKKDTNDTRESTAIYVADHLLNEQAHISVYDPKVSYVKIQTDLNYLNTRTEAENEDGVSTLASPYDTLKDAHAVAIMTEWDEFKTYDWEKIYADMKKPAFIFDGRNILDKSDMEHIGFEYYSIGQ